jgi:hypothetical protein
MEKQPKRKIDNLPVPPAELTDGEAEEAQGGLGDGSVRFVADTISCSNNLTPERSFLLPYIEQDNLYK